jgi:phosphoribosylformylglycinamidine synthase
LRLPIAHAEGRFQAAPHELELIEAEERVALRYCDRDGAVVPDANPNGSLDAIAGMYGGPRRNVLGLMPHPERASEPLHGNEDGRALFEALVRSAAAS